MQTFFTNTYASKFIKALLYNTPVPLYNSVRSGDYLVEGFNYIYGLNVIKCLKSGYMNGIEIATPIDAEIYWNRTDIPIEATWVDGVFGNGAFVVISDSNVIARTLDGNIWRDEPIELELEEGEKIGTIAFGQHKFVLATTQGNIYNSADGIIWDKTTTSDSGSKIGKNAYKIYYGNGEFIALCEDSAHYYESADGATWYRKSFVSEYDSSATYSIGAFSDYNGIMYQCLLNITTAEEFNEEHWKEIQLADITFGNGRFVIISSNSKVEFLGSVINNEITWIPQELPLPLKWSSITFGYVESEIEKRAIPRFMAVAGGIFTDTSGFTNKYIYSENGINWSLGEFPYTANWHAVLYEDGLFTATSDDYMLNSLDGASDWKATKFPAYFTDPVSAVLFGTDTFKLDKNIETYQMVNSPSSIWNSIVFGNGVFLAINSINNVSAVGKKTVIEYEYSISKFAKYRTIAHYDFGYEYSKFTEKFISKYNYYDTETHEHLGNFLRLYQGQFDINLMPFYNCFSGRYIPDVRLCSTGIESTSDKNYKVAQVPIKFNKTYTIAIDCPSEVYMMPAMIKNSELIGFSRIVAGGKTENINPTKILTENKNIYIYPSLTFKSPVTLNIPNTNEVDYGDSEPDMYKKLQNYERNLYLLIQLPTENDSSIVVLEGDYTDTHYRKVFSLDEGTNLTSYEDWDVNMIDDLMLYNLQMLQLSDKVRHPFSPKLIEYLLLNVIDSEEEIVGNIKRVQNVIRMYMDRKSYGIWQSKMRPVIYNLFMNSEDNTTWDVNGFVDKNMESFLDRWRRS